MQRLIILGSGPAGLTAGIYASRGGVKPLVLEGLESGGQLMQTQHVANYPGFPGVAKGPEILAAIRRQHGDVLRRRPKLTAWQKLRLMLSVLTLSGNRF